MFYFGSAFCLQNLVADEGFEPVSGQRKFPSKDSDVFALLQESIKKKDVISGKRIQSHLRRYGLDCDAYWGDHLIRMFASCNKLLEADEAFRNVKQPTVYTWSAVISAHTKLGEDERAFELFHNMLQKGIQPDKITFLSALKACRNLSCALYTRIVHDSLIKSGYQSDNVVANSLADVYAKCGNLAEAHCVFDMQPHHNVASWDAIIARHAQNAHDILSYKFFQQMQREGLKPGIVTYLCVLKGIMSTQLQHNGKHIHHGIIYDNFEFDEAIGNMLVDMYAKFGNIE